MRGEEKNPETKTSNDLTMNELLELLGKSVDYKPGSEEKKSSEVKRPAAEALKIDEGVYRYAESEVTNSDAVTAVDDTDLDFDELYEKYINAPKREREKAAEAASEAEILEGAVVRELELGRKAPETVEYEASAEEETFAEEEAVEEIEAAGEADEAETVEVISEALEEAVDEAQIIEEAVEEKDGYGEAVQYEEKVEPVQLSFADMVEDEPVYEDDEDMKIADAEDVSDLAEPSVEDVYGSIAVGEEAVEDVSDNVTTAVFDISKVRQIADEEDIDKIVDDAFACSATEVFTPVREEDVAEVDAEESGYTVGDDINIDQTDYGIMVALGMDEELKETVGEEAAATIESNIVREHEETSRMFAAEKKIEFTDHSQTDEIIGKFRSKYYNGLLRLAAAVAILLLVFLIENHSLLGLAVPSFMRPTSYPVVYAMIDLQLVVLAGVLVWRQVFDGVKAAIALKPAPECITAFMLIASVLYTFVAAFTAPVTGFAVYNLPVILSVILALVYEFLNIKRDVFSFGVVSTDRPKFVVSPVSDATETLEREVFSDYLSEDTRIVRVAKADFVDGFFARSDENRLPKPVIGLFIPAVSVISFVFLIVTFIITRSVYEAVTAGFIATAAIAPLSAFILYSVPFYKASKDAYADGSAIIGESSLKEYSGASVISFEDKEVFPSGGVNVKSIRTYDNNRIDEVLYCLASAFTLLGGPLADVFNRVTHDLGRSDDVELIEVEDDGFTVKVDEIHVFVGKASYVERNDFLLPADQRGRHIEQDPSSGTLYVAYNGRVSAKLSVQYSIDRDFESILAQLYKTGLCVGIKSFDPNIDDLLLAKKVNAMKYPVKVIRSRNVEDIPHSFERSDSGIVSARSVKSLLKTVALCERVTSVMKTGLAFKFLSMVIGIIGLILIGVFGKSFDIPSLYITLYQTVWVAISFVFTRFMI